MRNRQPKDVYQKYQIQEVSTKVLRQQLRKYPMDFPMPGDGSGAPKVDIQNELQQRQSDFRTILNLLATTAAAVAAIASSIAAFASLKR